MLRWVEKSGYQIATIRELKEVLKRARLRKAIPEIELQDTGKFDKINVILNHIFTAIFHTMQVAGLEKS